MSNKKFKNDEVLYKDSIFQAKNNESDALESGRRQTAPAGWHQQRKKLMGSIKSKINPNENQNDKNIKIELQ